MNLFSRIVITLVLAVLSSHYAVAYHNISPYAWCAGNPVRYIDEKGDSLAVLYSPNGANEFGHLAILIQNDDGQWALFSKNGTNSCSGISGPNDKGDNVGFEHFSSVVDFLLSNSNPKDDKGEREYVEAFVIPATNQEDILAIQGAKSELEKDYNLFSSNCAIMVQTALRNAGKDCGEQYNYIPFFDGTKIEYKPYINNLIPHKIYHNILDHNYGTRYYIKKY